MPEDRLYFNTELEPLLNTPRMREIQWEKLKTALNFFYEKVPFERRRFQRAGVTPADIRSFEDLAAIPFIGQADYRDAHGRGRP